VQETLGFLRIELQSHNVSAQLDVLPDLPAIKGNKAQLQELLVNLITNAVDAMSDVTDRPRVLRIRTSKSNPSGVSVRVEDTGRGVPAEQAARIFDPFFTTKTNGTGLGLAICRSIVEAHGGLISTAHGERHGSIFQIHLPAR
jgi:signal transduction histidine kinase